MSTQRWRAGSAQVVTFGRGEDGQLGHGDPEDQQTPLLVEELRGAQIGAVSCGAEYTVAVSQNGAEVYSWGWCAPLLRPAVLRHPARQIPSTLRGRAPARLSLGGDAL